jgi:hypothetical protein
MSGLAGEAGARALRAPPPGVLPSLGRAARTRSERAGQRGVSEGGKACLGAAGGVGAGHVGNSYGACSVVRHEVNHQGRTGAGGPPSFDLTEPGYFPNVSSRPEGNGTPQGGRSGGQQTGSSA